MSLLETIEVMRKELIEKRKELGIEEVRRLVEGLSELKPVLTKVTTI